MNETLAAAPDAAAFGLAADGGAPGRLAARAPAMAVAMAPLSRCLSMDPC